MITKGNFTSAAEKVAKKSFILGLGKEIKPRKELYFNVVSSDKLKETYMEVGDIGVMPDFDGTRAELEMEQGYESYILNKEIGGMVSIEYRFLRTEQLGIVKDISNSVGLAMRRRIAGDAASWFNDAFSAYLSRDGVSLCNSSHPSGVSNGPTQSNRITTAFSAVALASARIAHRKLLTNAGNIFEIMPTLLFGSIDLQDAFDEVIKSQGQVGTANNTINIHKGKWTAITDIRFTDTNNWGIGDQDLMKKYQIWQDVDDVDFSKDKEFDSKALKMAADAFYGFGSTGWEWFFGSEVD